MSFEIYTEMVALGFCRNEHDGCNAQLSVPSGWRTTTNLVNDATGAPITIGFRHFQGYKTATRKMKNNSVKWFLLFRQSEGS